MNQFQQWVADAIEKAITGLLRNGVPGTSVKGQLTPGAQGPLPPGGNTGDGYSAAEHDLVGDRHTASGLTTGQPLRATSATAFDFGPLDLGNTNATTGQLPVNRGGTGADFSATGALNHVVQQPTNGGPFIVGQLLFSQLTAIPTTLAGYGITDAQPLDGDLTAIAALTTTSFGRGFLTQADGTAARTYIGALADSLTATRIPYGSAGGAFTSEAGFEYIAADNEFRAGDRIRLPEGSAPSTPSSGFATTWVDSDGLWRSIDDAGRNSRMSYGRGTSFPGSWPANVPFFREDLRLWAYHDGTRWLSEQEYIVTLPWFHLTTLPFTGAAGNTLLLLPTRSDYGYYITRASVYTRVATTNNGSNYWSLRLLYGSTNLWDFNTSAQANDTNVTHVNSAINVATAATATFLALNAQTKTGTPGSLTTAAFVQYRLILT